MPYTNTRDTLGDTVTVDGLVDHSLTELIDDGVSTISEYACYYNDGLETLILPNITGTIGNFAFRYNTSLTTVILGKEGASNSIIINPNSFTNCTNLKHFVINESEKAIINATSVFDLTKISRKDGAVYVPTNLISAYKSDTNWCNFIIYDISQYPATSFETISDSWATILADTNPSAHYKVGDTKILTLGANSFVCQIAAFNVDILSNDITKYARITWILRDIYAKHVWNSTNTVSGGWASSDLRAWLINDVLPLLEASDAGASLQTVNKRYLVGSTTYVSQDKIWVPSPPEVNSSNNASYAESYYLTYVGVYKSGNSGDSTRIKYYNENPSDWWTRNPYSAVANKVYLIRNDGASTSLGTSPNVENGVCFGFCTGVYSRDSINDSWATILADTNPSAHYNVGDTKSLILDNETVVVCQIAAFNTDVLASDSSKTANITWIIQDIYKTKDTMNSSSTSLGGWEGSSLRTWLISDILPLLEASDVGASLQTVTKTYRTKHSTDTDTTKSCSDKIWIPSYKEIGGGELSCIESDGVVYSGLFNNSSSRIKYLHANGSITAKQYWLRSAASSSAFTYVGAAGTVSAGGASASNTATFVVFGFCTGASS